MKRILATALSALLLIPLAVAACGWAVELEKETSDPDATPTPRATSTPAAALTPTVEGERCLAADLDPGEFGRVEVGVISFRVDASWRLIGCADSPMRGIIVVYDQRHDERRQRIWLEVILRPIDRLSTRTLSGRQILENVEQEFLSLLKSSGSSDLAANLNDLQLEDAQCLGWDVTFTDREPEESWLLRARMIACLDPAPTPAFVVIASWSERHPPDIEPMTEEEVLASADPMLTSLQIASAPAP